MLMTKGTATAIPATPPATPVAARRKRLLPRSTSLSAMFRSAKFKSAAFYRRSLGKSYPEMINPLLIIRKSSTPPNCDRLSSRPVRGIPIKADFAFHGLVSHRAQGTPEATIAGDFVKEAKKKRGPKGSR
jgi:hypothetical protein